MTPFEKAERAKQLLADPVLRGAFESIKAGLVERLETVPMGDRDTQHEIALSLQLLKRLDEQLKRHLNEQAMLEAQKKHTSFIERMKESFA